MLARPVDRLASVVLLPQLVVGRVRQLAMAEETLETIQVTELAFEPVNDLGMIGPQSEEQMRQAIPEVEPELGKMLMVIQMLAVLETFVDLHEEPKKRGIFLAMTKPAALYPLELAELMSSLVVQ